MHKELLFALFGFEGNVFVRDRESGNMKVREDSRKVLFTCIFSIPH